jgi:hypothetical protein
MLWIPGVLTEASDSEALLSRVGINKDYLLQEHIDYPKNKENVELQEENVVELEPQASGHHFLSTLQYPIILIKGTSAEPGRVAIPDERVVGCAPLVPPVEMHVPAIARDANPLPIGIASLMATVHHFTHFHLRTSQVDPVLVAAAVAGVWSMTIGETLDLVVLAQVLTTATSASGGVPWSWE